MQRRLHAGEPRWGISRAVTPESSSSVLWCCWSTPDTDNARGEHRPGQGNLPTFSYAMHGQSVLMNNWEDTHYFTAAFRTLFPYGIGGPQDERTVQASLTAFAEWALHHHSRRQAALLHCCAGLIIFTDSLAIRP